MCHGEQRAFRGEKDPACLLLLPGMTACLFQTAMLAWILLPEPCPAARALPISDLAKKSSIPDNLHPLP